MPMSDDITFPCRRGGMADRRVICTAFAMWDDLRGKTSLPDITRFDPTVYPTLEHHLYVLRLHPTIEHSMFVSSGAMLDDAIDAKAAGLTVAEALPHEYREQFESYAAGVIMYRKPLTESGGFSGQRGVEIVHRNIMMPATDCGERVTHILGAFSYKTLRP